MKKAVSLLLVLALFSACGKSKSSKAAKNAFGEMLACMTVGVFNVAGDSVHADHDMKFYRRTVDRVLKDIAPYKKNKKRRSKYLSFNGKKTPYKAEKFWTYLTPETREILNYEINQFLLEHPDEQHPDIYKAVAVYFSSIRANFDPARDIKIKDKHDEFFAFTIRGQKTTSTDIIGSNCSGKSGLNLDKIKIPASIMGTDEILDILTCATERKEFSVTFIRDHVQVMFDKVLYPSVGMIKEDAAKTVTYTWPDSSLVVKKKKEDTLRGLLGKVTDINLMLEDSFTAKGVCTSRSGAF